MSASSHNQGHAPAGHSHGHGDGHHGQTHPHVSKKDYNRGFILSVILTAIPFGLVMSGVIQDSATTAMIVMGLGAVQIIVHMVYFLHMNRQAEGGWTFLALVFTVLLVAITLVGSLWVMYHLNDNLMPATNHNLRIAP
ncbi:MAG: cytochrome o ubiquinol oxidase subunit IV [Lautropia sp.]|nr:cytochrome o ubiquinol oxidase subunit IV [Lautropia sp.]